MSHRILGDGSTWPAPCKAMDELDWRLRHMPERVSHGDMVMAASIINAYRELVRCTVKRRNVVIRELRKGPNLPIPKEPT
jgi:hypothetical protein